jgi:hypothetical protein
MIFSRIRLGAQRARLMARYHIKQQASYYRYQLQNRRTAFAARNLVTASLVVRVMLLPLPHMAGPSVALAADGGGDIPDLGRGVEGLPIVLHFAPDSSTALESPSIVLSGIALGKSRETERLEQIEAERAAAEAKAAEEQRRILAEQAAVLARAKAQVEAARAAAEIPVNSIQAIAHDLTVSVWGEGEWMAMDTLIRRESNYNLYAVNRSSGACGLPQANPCSKLADRSAQGQINWMVQYIQSRYGTPSRALQFHNIFGYY